MKEFKVEVIYPATIRRLILAEDEQHAEKLGHILGEELMLSSAGNAGKESMDDDFHIKVKVVKEK